MNTVLSLSLLTILLSLSNQVYAQGVVITPWMIEMLEQVNVERAKQSLTPLCYNEKVIKAAQVHNQDMVDNAFFSHTGSDGSKPWDRLTAQGYSWMAAKENIAMGQTTVTSVMISWMNSPGHRSNILSDNVAHFGAAWHMGTNKWTQKFADSTSENCVDLSTDPPTASPTISPTASPTIPSGLCDVAEVTGQTLFLPGVPGANACWRVQLGAGGTLEGDFSDQTCSKDESEWASTSGIFSYYASANSLSNSAEFVLGPNKFQGAFKFVEDLSATGPSLQVTSFDSSTKTFEGLVTLPSCNPLNICPTMKVDLSL